MNYSTVNGTAKAGTDFTGVTNKTVVIPAGSTDLPINVSILGDSPQLPGGPADKYFTVNLSWAVDPANPQNIITATATGDIQQTFVPTVTIPATQAVHLSGGTYAVTLNVASMYPNLAYAQAAGSVSVSYSTSNGTATSASNYKGVSGVLTIPASTLVAGSSTINIQVTGKGLAVGQTFNMTLSNISNGARLPARRLVRWLSSIRKWQRANPQRPPAAKC